MRYGLIGEKLAHSFSKEIHSHMGNYPYDLFELKEDEVAPFLKREDIGGLNVTIPYKKTVMSYLSHIDGEAKEIGSVNTLVFKSAGQIYGYNTDIYGFSYMAKRAGIDFFGKKIVILGSGGTSLTVRAYARKSGAKSVVVVSRRGEDNYENIEKHLDADIVVNTTPVGMYPNVDNSPLSLKIFKNLVGFLDVVYNPLRTILCLEAKDMGIPFASGLYMLVAQAKRASELFFDRGIGDEKIEETVKILKRERENIALVGMPGSGKTSIAKSLAEVSGREVVDIDEDIVRREQMSIPEIFERGGEELFRKIESDVLKDAAKEGGKIISTGGGAVLKAQNRTALRQNSKIYFIRRGLSLLETSGRPLSKNREELEKMYEKRLPIYQNMCDFEIANDAAVEDAAKEIWRHFCEDSCD